MGKIFQNCHHSSVLRGYSKQLKKQGQLVSRQNQTNNILDEKK